MIKSSHLWSWSYKNDSNLLYHYLGACIKLYSASRKGLSRQNQPLSEPSQDWPELTCLELRQGLTCLDLWSGSTCLELCIGRLGSTFYPCQLGSPIRLESTVLNLLHKPTLLNFWPKWIGSTFNSSPFNSIIGLGLLDSNFKCGNFFKTSPGSTHVNLQPRLTYLKLWLGLTQPSIGPTQLDNLLDSILLSLRLNL